MAIASPRTRSREPDPGALRLEPPDGLARRPRLSWIAFGLAVVLVSGLIGVITVARVADRQPVLALDQPLERGETLTVQHLRVVDVAVDTELPLVAAADSGEIVGLMAAGPIPAGTLLSRDHFVEGPPVPVGWTVVGLALQPGQYPVGSLRPGDRVMVVHTPPPGADGGADTVSVLTDVAEIYAIDMSGEAVRVLMVSVAVPADVAPAVTAAAARGHASVVLVAGR